jgi:hypothetical protein
METYTTIIEQGDFKLLDFINTCTSYDIKITIDKVADYRERKIMVTLEGSANDIQDVSTEYNI